ncbi:MAG: FKBP-type peptidyl-prolyl cis-trans isomerase [Hyphomonadaceae bacterium]|nr:FKBP-type peptidyl-prolyl cis-trans isomerase [Hyphomonadaceae bacterium]
MNRHTKSAAAMIGLLALTACASLPSMPSGVFAGSGLPDCPELETGPAPYVPPFPAECRTMNKTASGVRYIPIANGDMQAGAPRMDATIVVNYEAFLAETGQLIDSSYARGESSVYDMSDLIDGWAEAVSLMNPGDEWLVYVPSTEAFGEEALGDLIPAGSDLVYRVELEGFLSNAELQQAAAQPATPVAPSGPDMAAWQVYLPWDPDKPGVTTLPSGVSLVALERGPADGPTPGLNDTVRIHYEGRLAETSDFFDSSWSAGGPAEFRVGSLIAGFTEALTYLRPGDHVLVHIPAEQAYGAQGAGDVIPPNADLMFQIIMLDILPGE